MSTILDNLLNEDKDFSESKFKSKVSNEFVQIKLSIVTGKIEKIKHFVNDDVYNNIVKKLDDDIKNNRIQIYEELNVANVDIMKIQEFEDRFEIDVKVHSKAYEYYIERKSKKYISGDRSERLEKYTNIKLTKIKNAKDLKNLRKCPTCGAVVDVNFNGICSFCKSVFDLQNYDWIITYMEI